MSAVVKQVENKIVAGAKKSVLLDMAERYGIEPSAFEAIVRSTCLPPDKKTGRQASREEFAAFLLVAKEYNLNPLTKEIFAFVGKNGGIQPIVSVDGWSNLANAHPAFDGMDFEDHANGDALSAITCRIYRKDRGHPISATEYMTECRRGTEPWDKWPRRMLRHKAFIQAARYAFGFAGIADQDEAERIAADTAVDVSPRPRPSVKDAFDEFAQIENLASEPTPHDPETGEVDQTDAATSPFPETPINDSGGTVPTWESYVEHWNGILNAATPPFADQIEKTWSGQRKLRNAITWPEDTTFSDLQRRVKEAIEMLKRKE